MEKIESDDLMLKVVSGGVTLYRKNLPGLVQAAAEWCGMDVAEFVAAAIEDRLVDVQAAMDEEEAGGG